MHLKQITSMILMLIVLAGCSTATPTPSPSPEVSPTEPPPTATATQSPTATLEPTQEPSPTLLPTVAAPALEGSGVLATTDFSVAAPQGAATIVEWNQVNGTPIDPNVPPYFNGLPPHLLVVFDKEAVSLSDFNPSERQGRILPIQAYNAMYQQAGTDDIQTLVNDLQTILTDQPVEITGAIPILPPLNATQIYRARIQYLSFNGGEGVAFVTSYAQGINPITNDNLYYFFQGLSADGEQYVSFVYPVRSADLPDTIDQVSQDTITALEADPNGYYAAITDQLNAAAPSSFTPNLDTLAGMFRSISISTTPTTPTLSAATQPPAGVTPLPTIAVTPNLTPQPTISYLPTPTPTPVYAGADILGRWFWVSLTPPSGSAVSPTDPDKYSVTFNANGTLSAISDCNTAQGTFTLRRANLAVDFTSGTTENCGNNSLSGEFIDAVEDAASYQVDGNSLAITLKNGGSMRLTK